MERAEIPAGTAESSLHTAVFRFQSDHARSIYRAIEPEANDEGGGRSTTQVWMEGDRLLVLQVTSQDISALRAALNMWLRLINVAYEMQEMVQRG